MIRRIAIAALLVQLLGVSLAAQETKNLDGEAYRLLRRALDRMDLSNADNVRSDLTDAAKIMRARNDAFGEWLALANLAWIESALGRSTEAITQVQKAFTVIHDANRSTAPFNVKTFIAFASDLGMPRETINVIESNADAFKPWLLQHCLAPFTHDLYGSLLTESGQLEKAEEQLNQAVASVKPLGGRYDYSIASHFGDLLFRQHRYDEARAHYQKALDGISESVLIVLGDLQLIEMRVYDRLALIEIIRGHPEETKRWNDKALQIARLPDTNAGLKDALQVAKAMKNASRQAAIEARIGNLQMTNRKYGSAAAHFERSLELYRSLSDSPPAETYTWGDLCLVYIQTRNYAAAESVLAGARKRVGKKSKLGDDMLAFIETLLLFHRGKPQPKPSRPPWSGTSDTFRPKKSRQPTTSGGCSSTRQRCLRRVSRVQQSHPTPCGWPRARSSFRRGTSWQRARSGWMLLRTIQATPTVPAFS